MGRPLMSAEQLPGLDHSVGKRMNLPLISVGIVDISYLRPKFTVKLDFIFQSSWAYTPKMVARL